MSWPVVALVVLVLLQVEIFLLLWAVFVRRPNWLLEQEMKHQLLREPLAEEPHQDTLIKAPPADELNTVVEPPRREAGW